MCATQGLLFVCFLRWSLIHHVAEDGLKLPRFSCLYHRNAGSGSTHHHTRLSSGYILQLNPMGWEQSSVVYSC